jgi:amidase
MTEWANFMTDHMPNGYSSRGGQVRNPHGPGHVDPGGSSSGSAAGVAAAFAAAGVGTETSGSILSPASQNGLVGLKPTVGAVSRRGIIPISPSQDTAGPIARTVRDAALLFAAMAGADDRDPATLKAPAGAWWGEPSGLSAHGLKGVRLGIPGAPAQWPADMLERIVRELEACGATIIRDVDIPEREDLPGWAVLQFEFRPALDAYLAKLAPSVPVHSLADVVRFNRREPWRCLRYGQTQLVNSMAAAGGLNAPGYWGARGKDLRIAREGLSAVLSAHHLHALLFSGARGAALGAKAGWPSLTVPAGFSKEGEPEGLTFLGPAFQEAALFRMGFAYEANTQHRRSPELGAV